MQNITLIVKVTTTVTKHVNTTPGNSIFWTSSIISLLIISLHYLREACVPDEYRNRVVLLHNIDRVIGQISSLPLSRPVCSKEGIDDAVTPVDEKSIPLYQDDHIIIFRKSECHGIPTQIFSCKWKSCDSTGDHLSPHAAWQFAATGAIYLLQCYLVHKAANVTLRMVELGDMSRVLAWSTLLLPTALLAFTSLFFAATLNTVREHPEGLSQAPKFLAVDVLGCMWLLSCLSFLVPAWKLLLA